jgi:hypothetical protein
MIFSWKGEKGPEPVFIMSSPLGVRLSDFQTSRLSDFSFYSFLSAVWKPSTKKIWHRRFPLSTEILTSASAANESHALLLSVQRHTLSGKSSGKLSGQSLGILH